MNEDKLRDDVAKFLGLPPWNTPTNISYADPYVYRAGVQRYGQEVWEKAIEDAKQKNK